MTKSAFVVFLVLLLVQNGFAAPLFKVFCGSLPIYRGRVDSIVTPGSVSGHVHKVSGGSNFDAATAAATPIQVYNDIKASPCTTCSIKTVDNSAYWHPDLYYKWPNGSLSLVPTGGLTVYYLFRAGSGAQANPAWKAFPPGFRMVSGNPFRRSFDSTKVAHKAINFACLSEPGGPETNEFPTATRFCKNGLRLQVHFPQCWDGVNLDSPSHTTHVAFPTRPDGGDCPSTHPVRLPNIFFEAFYSVDKFPHGTGTQPFVLANGDSSGYGFHGDFLNGWDQTVLQNAINHASCDATSTNNGNNVKACTPLAPYVQETPAGACFNNKVIKLTEHIGFASAIPALPGNNPITGPGADAAIPAVAAPSLSYKAPATVRYHLKSVQTGKYLRAPPISTTAMPVTSTVLTYNEVFTSVAYGSYVGIVSEYSNKYITAGGSGDRLIADRGSASDWEQFQFVAQTGGRVAIIAKKNGKYVTVQSDNTLAPTSTTIGNAQLFEQVQPDGGSL